MTAPSSSGPLPPPASSQVEAVAAALCSPSLRAVVDLVAYRMGERAVVVLNHAGAVRLTLDGDGTEQHQILTGRDPVANTDPLAFLPYERERADPGPPNERNAYPEPARRLLSLFSDPDRSPDLVIVHTPRHFFPETGGHHGEHGSLDVVQSRAPFLLAGAGVPARGVIDGWTRIVDVAPTLLHLAGVPASLIVDGAGRALDGRPRADLAEPTAGPVIGLLWDGAHSSDLLALASAGELPAVARLLPLGTALSGGAVAEFPSVTLCNHTSALTGVGPGRHGILGNIFYDRVRGEQINANSSATWHRSADWLRPGVATVFETFAAAFPSLTSACVDEAIDRGATSSTMQLIREQSGGAGAGALNDALPPAESSPYLTSLDALSDDYYRWATRVDDIGLAQMLGLFSSASTAPALTWWSTVVTDAGHHAGGTRSAIAQNSLREADRRLGAFLGHLDELGLFASATFLLTADHGFEAADPSVRGSWAPELAAACAELGVTYRDEGPGFVYLNV